MAGEFGGGPEGVGEGVLDALPVVGAGFEELAGDGVEPAVELFVFVKVAEVFGGFVSFDLEGFFVGAGFLEGGDRAVHPEEAAEEAEDRASDGAGDGGDGGFGDEDGEVSEDGGGEGDGGKDGQAPGAHGAFDALPDRVGLVGIEVGGEVGVLLRKLARGHAGALQGYASPGGGFWGDGLSVDWRRCG